MSRKKKRSCGSKPKTACLLEQAYVIDPDQKVGKIVEALGKEIGAEVSLTRYVRFQLGEGLEKKEDDFAAEVAALSK